MPQSMFTGAHATIVAALVNARQSAGLTQVALAARLSKPQSFISKIERGERRIDLVEFCAVARALGAKPSTLLGTIEPSLPDDLAI